MAEADWKKAHPILLAELLGLKKYKAPGRIYLPELETSYLLRSTGHLVFTDRKEAILRRHVILLGPQDSCKSQVARDFFDNYTNCRKYIQTPREERGKPNLPMTVMDLGGGTTWESIRGGFNEGSFYMPILHDVDYLFASELFAFLGHTPAMMKQKVDNMNMALQEKTTTVSLVKAMGARPKEKARFAEEIQGTSIIYDEDGGKMEYDSNFCFIGCTRKFTAEQYDMLQSCGFFGRHAIAEWNPGQQELVEYSLNPYGPVGECRPLAQELRRLNDYARAGKYEQVNYPDEKRIAQVMRNITIHLVDIANQTGKSFEEVRPGRVWQQITQSITAHALSREIKRQFDAGAPLDVKSITYEEGDYLWAENNWLTIRLRGVALRAQSTASDDPVLASGIGALSKYLKGIRALAVELPLPDGIEMSSTDLMNEIRKQLGISEPSAYKRIHRLHTAGYLKEVSFSGRKTVYEPTEHAYWSAGVPELLLTQQEMIDALVEMELMKPERPEDYVDPEAVDDDRPSPSEYEEPDPL